MNTPDVLSFFDTDTATISYLVVDPATRRCAIIDSVLDYDPAAGATSTVSADKIVAAVRERDLTVEWILETHVHADHLSASHYLKGTLGGKEAIGNRISQVQNVFGDLFNAEPEFRRDGSQFDTLFADDETFMLGSIPARVISTPGHTPACVTYLIGDACFVGDTLFMPDYGTARCDFPGGDAAALYNSVQTLYQLPESTRMFLCHDYLPDGRHEHAWETTVGEQKHTNVHIRDGVTLEEFVVMRNERDAALAMPRLILPSVQVNMRAGRLPKPESNGRVYLKIPVNAF